MMAKIMAEHTTNRTIPHIQFSSVCMFRNDRFHQYVEAVSLHPSMEHQPPGEFSLIPPLGGLDFLPRNVTTVKRI